MATKTASVEPPRELGVLEEAAASAGGGDQVTDYMVAINSSTGDVVATWKGSSKRLSLGADVIQYHVGKVRNAVAARKHGALMFSANQPGA